MASIAGRLKNTPAAKYLLGDPHRRLIAAAAASFFCNLAYAFYYGMLGLTGRSLWFIVMCAYYIILSTMRFSAVLCVRKSGAAPSLDMEYFVMRLSGALLALLSIVLAVVTYLSLSQNIATQYGEIVMITIAAYTFGKLTAAVIRAVRQRGDPSPLFAVIRSIGYADVAASVLTLQRSMLVSFGAMDKGKAQLLNAVTGAGVFLFVCSLGIALTSQSCNKGRSRQYGKIENRTGK